MDTNIDRKDEDWIFLANLAAVISASVETEDGGTETNERPSGIEHSPPTVEQIEDSEPEEWDQAKDEFTEFAIQKPGRTGRI